MGTNSEGALEARSIREQNEDTDAFNDIRLRRTRKPLYLSESMSTTLERVQILQYQRCTRIALGLKKLMAGRRRVLEETRAYVTHERCRGILSNDEIIKRGALAANGVTSKIYR